MGDRETGQEGQGSEMGGQGNGMGTGKQDGGTGGQGNGTGKQDGGTGGQGNGTGGTGKQDEIFPCKAAPCLRIAWPTGACMLVWEFTTVLHIPLAPPKVPTDELSEDQLRKIKDKLITHAARWENIAQGLHFRAGEIETICSMPHLFMGAPVSFLNQMLDEWYQWHPGDARESTTCATAGAIIEAVNKAGLGKTAHKLKTILQ